MSYMYYCLCHKENKNANNPSYTAVVVVVTPDLHSFTEGSQNPPLVTTHSTYNYGIF